MSDQPARTSVYRRGARLVWRFCRTHPVPMALSVLGATLFSAAVVATSVVIGKVTDRLITPAFTTGVSSSTIVGGALVLGGVGVIRGLSIIARRYFAAMTEARMQATLRTAVVDKYLTVPMAFHDRKPVGELLAHAEADVTATTLSIKPLPFSIGVAALVVFSLASLAAVDWAFLLVGAGLFPALLILNRVYTGRIEIPSAALQQRLGDVSAVAHESFDGALVVKTLGIADRESTRFAAAADRLREASLRVGRIDAVFNPLIDIIPSVATLTMLVIGLNRVRAGQVTVGEVVQAAALFGSLAFPFRVFGFFLQSMPRAVVSIDRVDAVLAESDEPRPERPRAIPDGPLEVSFRDVRFSYGDTEVLAGVSFDIAPGETVALVGSTASGKSTLVSLLSRLADPASGTITLNGTPIDEADPDAVRRAVSVVFQESYLFADSVRANVALDADPSDVHLDQVADVARVDRFLPRLHDGWDTIVGERGVTLSGGQRQRVALARALARRPRLLVLDDATSAVDPTIEAQILEGLKGDSGTTLLIVAHRLSTIRLADRVVFLSDGVVRATGTHDELLALADYESLVTAYESDQELVADLDDDDRVAS